MKIATASFAGLISDSRGTIIFGNGLTPIKVEVIDTGDDYITCDTEEGERLVIPVSSIAYYKFAS